MLTAPSTILDTVFNQRILEIQSYQEKLAIPGNFTKKQCSCGSREALDIKVFSYFLYL